MAERGIVRGRQKEAKADRGGSGKAVSEYANKMSLNNAKDKREWRQTKFNLIVAILYMPMEREREKALGIPCSFACLPALYTP